MHDEVEEKKKCYCGGGGDGAMATAVTVPCHSMRINLEDFFFRLSFIEYLLAAAAVATPINILKFIHSKIIIK